MPPNCAVEAMREALETAWKADPQAIEELLQMRRPCNEKLGNHPTVQVRVHDERPSLTVSVLGLLNGLVGAVAPGMAVWVHLDEDTGKLVGFHAGPLTGDPACSDG